MEMRLNRSLGLNDLPAADAPDRAVFAFATTFPGYEVWGGFDSCALVANSVAARHRADGVLPSSLTLLRTALFFESRRERFVDFGGLWEERAGWAEHRDYMRRLLDRARELIADGEIDEEVAVVASWLAEHDPAVPLLPQEPELDGWLRAEELDLDDGHLAAAVALSARMLSHDFATGARIDEKHLRARLGAALRHLAPAYVEYERHVPIIGFQGVGPVDVVLRDRYTGAVIGLIECKWSIDRHRDKIYEAAWDAIKLALADGPTRNRWLLTGALDSSWPNSETADLFADGTIDTVELWSRPLSPRGPNGGMTVGADCAAGGRGNMFTHAPERLRIKAIATGAVGGAGMTLKAARISGAGDMVGFADPPEFPALIGQRWLEVHVPAMAEAEFQRLLVRLRAKGWTEPEIAQRVLPLRA
jgi:hypothetical protein